MYALSMNLLPLKNFANNSFVDHISRTVHGFVVVVCLFFKVTVYTFLSMLQQLLMTPYNLIT